jgi:outer membrane protein assembly factor BamB
MGRLRDCSEMCISQSSQLCYSTACYFFVFLAASILTWAQASADSLAVWSSAEGSVAHTRSAVRGNSSIVATGAVEWAINESTGNVNSPIAVIGPSGRLYLAVIRGTHLPYVTVVSAWNIGNSVPTWTLVFGGANRITVSTSEVVLVSGNTSVAALDGASGILLWSTAVPVLSFYSAVEADAAGDRLIAVTVNTSGPGNIIILNASSGTFLYMLDTGGIYLQTARVFTQQDDVASADDGGVVFFSGIRMTNSSNTHCVAAVRNAAAGNVLWVYEPDESLQIQQVYSLAYIQAGTESRHGTVIVTLSSSIRGDDAIVALDSSAGVVLWQRAGLDLGSFYAPAAVYSFLGYNTVIVIDDNALVRLNGSDGSVQARWQTPVSTEILIAPVISVGGVMYSAYEGIYSNDPPLTLFALSGARANDTTFVLLWSTPILLSRPYLDEFAISLDNRLVACFRDSMGIVVLVSGTAILPLPSATSSQSSSITHSQPLSRSSTTSRSSSLSESASRSSSKSRSESPSQMRTPSVTRSRWSPTRTSSPSPAAPAVDGQGLQVSPFFAALLEGMVICSLVGVVAGALLGWRRVAANRRQVLFENPVRGEPRANERLSIEPATTAADELTVHLHVVPGTARLDDGAGIPHAPLLPTAAVGYPPVLGSASEGAALLPTTAASRVDTFTGWRLELVAFVLLGAFGGVVAGIVAAAVMHIVVCCWSSRRQSA